MRLRLDGLAPVFREFRKLVLDQVALGLLNYRREPVIQEDILFDSTGMMGAYLTLFRASSFFLHISSVTSHRVLSFDLRS